MKTVAIKVEDDLHAQLLVVAQLEGVTLTEVIRHAVETHIEQLRKGNGLAAKAKGFLDAIDQEAKSRKQAVESLINQLGAKDGSPARPKRRTPTGADSES